MASLKIIAILLVGLAIPFVCFGVYLEPQITAVVNSQWLSSNPSAAALVAIGLLVSDLLLPIPSSVVCTMVGAMFGTWRGMIINWLGMTLAAVIGYEAARAIGSSLPQRWHTAEVFDRANSAGARIGAWSLVLCRGIPLLAEATVLAAGVRRLDRWTFWLVVATANLGISIAYAALGSVAIRAEWLAIALSISIGAPAILLLGVTRSFQKSNRSVII